MSLILDALARSAAERRDQTDTRVRPPQPRVQPRRPSRLAPALAIVVGSTLLAWYGLGERQDEAKRTGVPPPPAKESATIPQVHSDKSSGFSASVADERLQTASAQPSTKAVPISVAVDDETIDQTARPDVMGRETRSVVTARDEVALSKRLPELAQLPANLRQAIGDLQLNIHVYNRQSAQRFVLINLRRYAEGDILSNGITVVEIRSDGVLLDRAGVSFLLPTSG